MNNVIKTLCVPALAAVLLFAAGATGTVQAQDEAAEQPKAADPVKKTTETIGTWTVICSEAAEKSRCVAQQQLANTKNKQVVAAALVRLSKEGGAELVLQTPSGVILAPGVTLTVDGEEAGKAPFEICAPRGCEASLLINQDLINKLAKGKSFTVTVQSMRGKSVALEFQLDGFTKAYAAFKNGVTK